jgi:hypothetical protein
MDGNLCTVTHLCHTTQVITKEEGARSTWHYGGPSPRKKTAYDDDDKPTAHLSHQLQPSKYQAGMHTAWAV